MFNRPGSNQNQKNMRVFKSLFTLLFFYTAFQVSFSQEASQSNPDTLKNIFSIGVVADIQYADVDKAGNRDYRNSLPKLDTCINIFNRNELSFMVSLGDMIDRDYVSYDKPLKILAKSKAPVYNVIGNHDFSVDDKFKRKVRKRLANRKGYFAFKLDDFIFIILDGTDFSTFAHKEGSKQYKKALIKFEEIKKKGLNNAYIWNGGIGDKQLEWLDKQLELADEEQQKAVLFCHWPLLPESGAQLWNNTEVLDLLKSHNSVIAWIAGHHHEGGYEKAGKIHHLTLKGMVEAKSETSCGIMEVYPDKIILIGYGDQNDRILEF